MSEMKVDGYDFACPQCYKKYKYKWNMLRHSKYECGKPPQFVCQICCKAFTQKSSLKSHIAYIHGINLSCP
ncbi:hypothetical protein WA026_020860 [Henosepilachna vigintioctopunctata]|uniref:C2H2-type domain-containing protein n=1 Tax=Henosepilachna vigintioctopunctata TaxID=420089 RepID=A0AAW1UI34_9CUCU